MGEIEDQDAGAFNGLFEGGGGDEVRGQGNLGKVFDVFVLGTVRLALSKDPQDERSG